MQRTQKGFSIVETLVAVALLIIVIWGVSSFVTGQKKIAQVITGSEECANYSHSLLDSLTSIGTRDVVLPALLPNDPSGATLASDPRFVKFLALLPSGVNYWQYPVIGSDAISIMNTHLILGAPSFLEALYNSSPSYCLTNTTAFPPALIVGNSGLVNPRVTLQIEPVRISTQAVLDCNSAADGTMIPLRIGPKTSQTPYSGFVGNNDIGFRATVYVQHDTKGSSETCSAQASYYHQLDNVNNGTPRLLSLTDSSLAPLNNTVAEWPTSCGYPGGGEDYRNIRAVYDFSNAEAGSLPVCSANGITWQPCSTFTFGSRQAGAPSVTVNGTTITLLFSQLTKDEKYFLYVSTVDTAGNIASVDQVQWIVDGSRPKLGPPTFGGNIQTVTGWSSPQVQCATGDGILSFPYTTDPITETYQNCTDCTANTVPVAGRATETCTGRCQVTVDVTGHAQVDVSARARDVCGNGDPRYRSYPALITWAPQNASPSPKAFTQQDSGPYYEMSVPQPHPVPTLFKVDCDCQVIGDFQNINPASAVQDAIARCRSTNDLAPNACYRPAGTDNFSATVSDPCSNHAPTVIKGQYDVLGDPNDNCGQEACRTGLVCAQGDAGPVQQGKCYDPGVLGPPICTQSALRVGDISGPGCSNAPEIYTMNVTGRITGSDKYFATARTCPAGSADGEVLTYTVTGTCSGGAACVHTPCYSGTCSSAQACVSGPCTFTDSGPCAIVFPPAYTTLGSTPSGGTTNSVCPARPFCGAITTTTSTTTTTSLTTTTVTTSTTTSTGCVPPKYATMFSCHAGTTCKPPPAGVRCTAVDSCFECLPTTTTSSSTSSSTTTTRTTTSSSSTTTTQTGTTVTNISTTTTLTTTTRTTTTTSTTSITTTTTPCTPAGEYGTQSCLMSCDEETTCDPPPAPPTPPCCNGSNYWEDTPVPVTQNKIDWDFLLDVIGLPRAYARCPGNGIPYPVRWTRHYRCL